MFYDYKNSTSRHIHKLFLNKITLSTSCAILTDPCYINATSVKSFVLYLGIIN